MQPRVDLPLLLVGATGKLIVVLIAVGLYIGDQLPGLTTLLILGDLVFVVVWGSFIVQQQKHVRSSIN